MKWIIFCGQMLQYRSYNYIKLNYNYKLNLIIMCAIFSLII